MLIVFGAAIAWFGFLKPEPPPISDEDRAQLMMMPLPSELEFGSDYFDLDNGFSHTFSNISTPRLERAVKRFYSRLDSITGASFSDEGAEKLILDCKKENGRYPMLKDDESYYLTVSDDNIQLSANSETGILYGLESLAQLVKEVDGKWIIPEMELKDYPRFPWRGLMIDVARHWVSKETILRNLDAMATVKMNILHWHLTEYQGFRVESKKFPRLHEMGSEGNYYSQEDIREVIEYAADRGIRVVPEFDLPGHSTAWFVGHPELASAPGPYVLDSLYGILDPVMDPTRDEVYNFLDEFFGEMAELFPDTYLHIGGDEVKPKHWEENPDIQKFMKENNIEDFHELQAYFNIRLQKILKKHGKQMMGWDEIIHPDLPKDGITVQSWRSHKTLWEAAKLGNKAILSAGYYLDHKRPAGFHYSVDPTEMVQAVTIDIDSTNWRAWECKMFVQDTELEVFLYLFGEGGDNVRGIMSMAGSSNEFKDVRIEGNTYSFVNNTSFGEVDGRFELEQDSLHGNLSLSLINMDLLGRQVGGSTMNGGIELPKFEKIEPLTPAEEANILGGEACMWSEVVDNRNIDSRIWPRTAAIAEKLWSPRVLTKNEDDMYRRLMIIDQRLENNIGMRHLTSSETLLAEMVPEAMLDPLKNLVDVLEEVKMYERMAMYNGALSTKTPLNRIVDAARPESYLAYRFNKDVDQWLKTGDADASARIIDHLKMWSENHTQLLPAFGLSEKYIEDRLKEVQAHSENLSQLSKVALEVMNDNSQSLNPETDSLISQARQSHGGTIMPVVDGLEKILKNSK